MRDGHKRFLTFAVTVALVWVVASVVRYVLAPRKAGLTGTPGATGLPIGVGVRVDKITFVGYAPGSTRRAWVLRADVVDASSDKMRVEARGNVQAELLDADTGKRLALVDAPGAVFSRATQTLQVSGKIVCWAPGTGTPDDLRVEADTLIWQVGTKQVVCSGAIHVALPQGSGTADGRDLTLDLTTHVWSLQKFRGTVVQPEDGGNSLPPFVNPLKNLPL